MCSRYLLLRQHYQDLLVRLGVAPARSGATRYDIAPGSVIEIVREQPVPDDSTSEKASSVVTADAVQWGLAMTWASPDDSRILVNARAESVTTKAGFREAFRSRRCVIPASGFYEWQTVGRTKKPWLFEHPRREPFGLAGVWNRTEGNDGQSVDSCAIITTEANAVMRPIHHRMPVILTPDQCQTWLAPTTAVGPLSSLLAPAPDDRLQAIPGLPRAELLAAGAGTRLEDAFANHFADPPPDGSPKAPDPFAPWFT